MNYTILNKDGYYILKNILTKIDIDKIKKELIVEPFQYYSKNIKKSLEFSVYKETEEYLIVPKYYGIKKYGKPNINNELIGDTINIIFKGALRDIQQNIINTILPYINQNNGGVLCLPCGMGKTIIALYLASYFKVKTLIIVHKTFLLHQWIDKIKEFTNANIGIIKQNKVDIENKDIVIGMLQSISKDKYTLDTFKDFGLVIFDEAHHAPSQYFSRSLPIISCRLTIGLSATPKRADKLEKVLYWYFGDIMYKVDNQENNKVSVNIINYKLTHDKFKEFKSKNGEINRPLTITKLTTIGRRNKFISDMIYNTSLEKDRKIIVLSDRIEHLKSLKNRIDAKNNNNIISDFYIGGMKQSSLDNAAETANVLFASYAMAAEGLDIPDLNTLFMVTSRKEIEQSIGRIIRKINPNALPVIYDITDCLPSFINQGRYRKKLYIKLGFQINIMNVEENITINTTSINNNTNNNNNNNTNNNNNNNTNNNNNNNTNNNNNNNLESDFID